MESLYLIGSEMFSYKNLVSDKLIMFVSVFKERCEGFPHISTHILYCPRMLMDPSLCWSNVARNISCTC